MTEKTKVYKLNFKAEFDFSLIGISSHENDYRLTWAFNNELKYEFVRTDDLKIPNPEKKGYDIFTKYTYVNEDTLYLYNLISNRCHNGFLLEEFKNIDFLLQIYGDFGQEFLKDLLNKIKKLELIGTAFQIDLLKLKNKSKSKLIF